MIYNIPAIFVKKNEGERRVHEAFTNLFEEKKYFSLYSIRLPGHKTKRTGECDFILISDRGILCLEVKGSSSVAKVGTKVKINRLVEGDDHNIDCKISGIGQIMLTSKFVSLLL